MNICRYLTPAQIQLGMRHGHLDQVDPEGDPAKERQKLKDRAVGELVALFERSGEIRNASKFEKDFRYRESVDSTALGDGVALPHVRSMQPRRTVIVVALSHDGVWFGAPDDSLTHIFFGIAAPSYDDKEMLKFHKWISNAFLQDEWLPAALLAAEDEHEIIRILTQIH